MIEYTCIVCGKIKSAKYKSHTKKFCSHKCSNTYKWTYRYRAETISYKCERCGKLFEVYKNDHRIKTGLTIRYCSKTCSVPKIEFRCVVCGEQLKYRKKTCSKGCELIYRRTNHIPTYNHNEYMKNYNPIYRNSNKEKLKEKNLNKLKTDDVFRFKISIRKHIGQCFKRKSVPKDIKTTEILGCTINEFVLYIESLLQDGMSLNNYGKWHLDHIVPLHTAKTKEDVIRLCHYSNYQPLWAIDNILKGSKYEVVRL